MSGTPRTPRLDGTQTTYHTCQLPTDHPNYRTQDYCQACNVNRALFGYAAGAGPEDTRHHASADQFCTIVGCEVCP